MLLLVISYDNFLATVKAWNVEQLLTGSSYFIQ